MRRFPAKIVLFTVYEVRFTIYLVILKSKFVLRKSKFVDRKLIVPIPMIIKAAEAEGNNTHRAAKVLTI